MNDCIFCKIIKKELPAEIVFEDENTLAFLDINPVNKGHVLVIPKKHTVNILDADADVRTHVYTLARRVAEAQTSALNADGVNISNNNGAAAGQEVFHYHVHVIPRFEGDGLSHWPNKKYKEGEMEKVGSQLSASI